MKNVVQNTLLLCASIGASLLAGELVVACAKPQDLSGFWREHTASGLIVNKSRGRARHQLGKRVVHYAFAAPHLRGPISEGNVRVLVLGDSFTFGYLLDHADTYVGLLQKRLDEEFGGGTFALLNAAVNGWGAGDYTAFVEELGDHVNPDVILILLGTDDVGRTLRSPLWHWSEDAMLTRQAVPTSGLKTVVNALPGYEWLLEHSHLVQLLRNRAAFRFEASRADSAPVGHGPTSVEDVEGVHRGHALVESLFRRLSAWSRERQVPVLVSTTGWHIPPYAEAAEPTEAFMATAGELFRDLEIPYGDPSEAVWQRRRAGLERYVIPDDGHPNEAGAALIAEHVLPFVRSELRQYCRQTDRCRTGAGPRPR